MSAEQAQNQAAENTPDSPLQPLGQEQLEQAIKFFKKRLVGQPQVVQALSNILYKQNALLKRAVELRESGQPSVLPADPTVILLMGGSWGKSLAAKLIPMALSGSGYGPLTELAPLPQDPDGTLYLEPELLTVPFATVVVENIEITYGMNVRFVNNLAHLISSGLVSMTDDQGNAFPIPLGLTTFILTTGIADDEIRQALSPGGHLGFLPADAPLDAQDAYQEVQRICKDLMPLLPTELLREVDETVILRPLGQKDLHQVFELEIADYTRAMFPGRELEIVFDAQAQERLFAEAVDGLEIYGVHALRRVLQRHIDPIVYRAYNTGQLGEEVIENAQVRVSLAGDVVEVKLDLP